MFGFKKKTDPIAEAMAKHLKDYEVPESEAKIIQDFVKAYADTDNTVPYRKVAEMINKVEQMV